MTMAKEINYKGLERELIVNEMDRQISEMELEAVKRNFANEISNASVDYIKPVKRKMPFKMRLRKWCSNFGNKMVKTLG